VNAGNAPIDTITRFRFGDVFPADDPVAEWVATITLAFNDIELVHGQFDEAFDGPAYRYLYLLRVALGHFNEAAAFLEATAALPEIHAFVRTLPDDVRASYKDSLRRYAERKSFLGQVRNLSAFHYPAMSRARGRKRVMQRVLADLEDATTSMFRSASGTIGDSRQLFGDDIVSRLFTAGAKTDDELYDHHAEVREAITSFMRFANGAINEWFGRAIDRGVVFATEPGSPPSFGDILGQQRAADEDAE